MSECKISNCAFYTSCYGKQTSKQQINKQMNSCWVWIMRGNGLFPAFWFCIFIHVYFLRINNILKLCLLTNSDNGPVLNIIHS